MTHLPYAGAETEPEQPEPGPEATELLLAEDQNRRLEDENRQFAATNKRLVAALRAAGKVLEPYVHAINGEPQ